MDDAPTPEQPGTVALVPDAKPRDMAPGSMFNLIASALTNPDIDADKLEKLLAIQASQEDREAARLFNKALHAAQQDMPRITKNGVIRLVKDGKDKGSIPFARFEDVMDALKPIMVAHSLSVSFSSAPRSDGTGLLVSATLRHAAGHSQDYSLPVPPDLGAGRNALQAIGSALSYGKRYLLEMIFNIVREGADDDGKAGGTTYASEADLEMIERMLKDSGANRAAFLDWLEIDSLDQMRAEQVTRAKNALAKAKAQAKKAAGDA